MAALNSLTLPQLYQQVNKTSNSGVAGYYIPKKYEDPILQMKMRELSKIPKGQKNPKHQTKRGSYIDDEIRLHKQVPGPGVYNSGQDLWPSKSKTVHGKTTRITYFDELVQKQKRQKKPAPGQYEVFKSLKQQELQNKKLAQRKVPIHDRITYLDQAQFGSNELPGVGMYNPRQRISTQPLSIQHGPETMRKKHREEEKRKNKPKNQPDMGTYHPQSADLQLFSNKIEKSLSSNLISKLERFKTLSPGYNLGPGKYVDLQIWKGKEKKTAQRNGLDSLSKGPSKSVYYH